MNDITEKEYKKRKLEALEEIAKQLGQIAFIINNKYA